MANSSNDLSGLEGQATLFREGGWVDDLLTRAKAKAVAEATDQIKILQFQLVKTQSELKVTRDKAAEETASAMEAIELAAKETRHFTSPHLTSPHLTSPTSPHRTSPRRATRSLTSPHLGETPVSVVACRPAS